MTIIQRDRDGAQRHESREVIATLTASTVEEVRVRAAEAHCKAIGVRPAAESADRVRGYLEEVLWGWGVKLDDEGRRFVDYMAGGDFDTTAGLCGLLALALGRPVAPASAVCADDPGRTHEEVAAELGRWSKRFAKHARRVADMLPELLVLLEEVERLNVCEWSHPLDFDAPESLSAQASVLPDDLVMSLAATLNSFREPGRPHIDAAALGVSIARAQAGVVVLEGPARTRVPSRV